MPSHAFTSHLNVLLQDVDELTTAHRQLATGLRGRQWGLGALNRAALVLSVSSWEAYIEELVREGVRALRPPTGPLGLWPALDASIPGDLKRFNTPNADNTKKLISESFGLADITLSWHWHHCSITRARTLLNDVMDLRHKISHGVNPRPVVHNFRARWLPGFFRRLGSCTDESLSQYLQHTCGIGRPW
jgi:hypothetical protein